MAAIRCAGAGRMLLRRAPGLLRRASVVGERGALHRQPLGALAPSSNRCISSYYTDGLPEYEKKKLAVELMKERSPDKEIENLDELLNLISSTDAWTDQQAMQAKLARNAIQDKKHELVSLLLRPDSNGKDYMKKMEELAVAARRHREFLVLEDLKRKCERLEEMQAKMIIGIALWGLPLTLITLLK